MCNNIQENQREENVHSKIDRGAETQLIFEKSTGRMANNFFTIPNIPLKEPESFFSKDFLRDDLPLPSVSELEVVRHYTRLSKKNFSVDTHFYPLGSCTMKYNPKINEDIAQLSGFIQVHPYQNGGDTQGALFLLYDLEKILCEITGMSAFSMQPSAGAHAELAGMLMIKAYHRANQQKRHKVIVPDSAHGTNPATARMCGYDVIVVRSTPDGLVDLDELNGIVDEDIAAMMLTNPNTLGLFEENIIAISDIIHKKGAILYYDGANFNPLLGITKPALMGFDVIHLNFHKTFATPHGSGGPGAAVVGANESLKEYLPLPRVEKKNDIYSLNYERKNSIGQVKAFYGNFLVLVKAYAYILRLGRDGLKRVAYHSVLNTNYIREKLKEKYSLASTLPSMHEVVFSCVAQNNKGVSALDIVKRLIDYGIHPPTMYFPVIVKEALMVEPTETEGKKMLDYFIQVMEKIHKEVTVSPEKCKFAPLNSSCRRVDEAQAARFPDLRWKPQE